MEGNFFKTNPEKAASRVNINAFMIGSLFVIFTLIWTLSPKQFSPLIISQLVLAMPLLFVSSLSYSKVGYRKEVKYWDYLGWFTNTIGNAFIFNVVGLLLGKEYLVVSYLYFGLIIVLLLVYSIINIVTHPHRIWEKIFKYLFFITIISLLGLLPLWIKL